MRTKVMLVAGLAAGLLATAAGASAGDGGLSSARAGTAAFHRLAAATAAGYGGPLVDVNGISCIDDPAGGMGVHYVRGDLVGDGEVSAATPEALVYEPQANGRMRLVAVEYVVLKSAWEAKHGAAGTVPVRPELRVRAGRKPLRPARLLRAPRLDLEAQPERHVRGLEPDGQLRGRLTTREGRTERRRRGREDLSRPRRPFPLPGAPRTNRGSRTD